MKNPRILLHNPLKNLWELKKQRTSLFNYEINVFNCLGFGAAAGMLTSESETADKNKMLYHNNKRGARGGKVGPDTTNDNNSTFAKENDAQSSAGSNISDDEAPTLPGVNRKGPQVFG